MVRQGRRK